MDNYTDDDDEDPDFVMDLESESDDDEIIEDQGDENTPIETDANNLPVYFCKDKFIAWTGKSDIGASRNRTENIIRERSGATGYVIHRVTSIKESFDICFTSQMKKIVVDFSNLEGRKKYGLDFKEIGNCEVEAYFGILLLIGVYRSKGESVRSLWDEFHGRPIFRAIMSLGRFLEICRVLRFDDRDNRRNIGFRDKLCPIRDLYNKWVENLPLLYVPNENITIDEQLISFRGRCPFKVYMPSKPAKYGMKAWVAADVKTKFCLNFQIYLGKESANAPPERNQGERVVLDLVGKYRGRNITTDNFFTTRNLALSLLQRNMTLVGTVRKNKRFLPQCGTVAANRALPLYTSRFFFNEKMTIVQYVSKKYKMVSVLSTLHHSENVLDNHPKKIPEIIDYYNSTKAGVDTIDQLVGSYSCKRQTNRWPIALFSNLIDLSALNGFVIYKEINPQWNASKRSKRRLYLEALGLELVNDHMASRSRIPRTAASAQMVEAVQANLQPSTSNRIATKRQASKRFTCAVCPSKICRKTFERCSVCNKPVCPQHRTTTTKTTSYCDDHKLK